MRTTLKAAAALVAAVPLLALAACGGSGGSETACKAAMTRDYAAATARHDPAFATEPAACKGLPAATLKRITGEVLTAAMASAAASPAPSATDTASWPSARAIAVQVGATGIQPATPSLYASDEVTATWHGRDVTVVTFASVTLKENWVKVASQFTPILTEGPQFAISDNGPAS